jgi:hypothetical protein
VKDRNGKNRENESYTSYLWMSMFLLLYVIRTFVEQVSLQMNRTRMLTAKRQKLEVVARMVHDNNL